jgi:hypothetical protein
MLVNLVVDIPDTADPNRVPLAAGVRLIDARRLPTISEIQAEARRIAAWLATQPRPA